jgi:hypothetical protein
VDGAATEGQRERLQNGGREGAGRTGEQWLEVVVLLAGDEGGAAEDLADVAGEDVFEEWDELVAQAVADDIGLRVGSVFAEFQAVIFDVGVDLAAPDWVERAEERERPPADTDVRGWLRQGEFAASAEQVDKGALDPVVGVVAEDDLAAVVIFAKIGEELVARLAGGGLDGEFLCLGQGADVGFGNLGWEAEFAGQFLDEVGVGGGLAAT